MSIIFYIGIVLLALSLISPVIFHYAWKTLNTAGKFWIMYMEALIGIILILISVLTSVL